MELPFTIQQFLHLFEQYNTDIWPMQIVTYILAITVLLFVFKDHRYSGRIVLATLTFFWLWNGLIYHLLYFSTINKAAYIFGVLFLIQAGLFILLGLTHHWLSFKFLNNSYSITASILILYAMLFYPVLNSLLGHGYPESPAFGLAPCPTTIFTFGILLLCESKVPKYILAIPLAWSVIGFSAALFLMIYEDTGLLLSGLSGTFMIIYKNYRLPDKTDSTI